MPWSADECWRPLTLERVHIAAGSWLLFWPLFDGEHWSYRLNIFVPFAFTCTLFVKGAILKNPNDPDVRSMSRTGQPHELLQGPLLFTLVMDVVGLQFFRTQVGALMMAALGMGDGLAALIGSRGTHHYYVRGHRKSLEGSAVCFFGSLLGGALFLRLLGLPSLPVVSAAIIALAATVVEAISPAQVENLLIPSAAYVAHLCVV